MAKSTAKSPISQNVQETYTEMLLRFAIAAEYKDIETGEHIIRVSEYSTAIAKALGLPAKDVELIKFASMMHDIGKIGIPDRVLHKKIFTEKERKIMGQHPIIGSRIFAGSNSILLRTAGEIAASHHERYDGTGYPYRLKGEKIPLFGRIVALADTFDALVSERVYKKAMKFDKAVSIIKKESGSHFDPKITDAFFKALPEIKSIFRANKTIKDFVKENKRLLSRA